MNMLVLIMLIADADLLVLSRIILNIYPPCMYTSLYLWYVHCIDK